MANPAIEIENLTKEYPFGFLHLKKKKSLEGLSMQVENGRSVWISGAERGWKIHDDQVLMRLIFPTSGTARILGKSIEDVSMHQEIGYLPEQPYFYDYLTAAELLDYFARFHGLTASGPARARANDAEEGGAGDARRRSSCGNIRKECCNA